MKWQHIAAATTGNALEFYDFLTYAFFSIQIGHAFFPAHTAYGSLMLSLATFGAGFVTRPLGAIVIGNYADRVGRKPAMMLCFVLIGCAIVGMALLPSYARIGMAAPILAIAARMIQGFSLGGEVGCNTAYLAEAAPEGKRGLIVSWQNASQLIALIAGSLVGVLLTSVLSPSALEAYGWRIAFLFGAAVVPFGLWLRTNLPETLHLPEQNNPAHLSRAKTALAHRRVLLLAVIVLGSGTIANYMGVYVVTYTQDTLHMPARAGFIASTAGYVFAIAVALLGGWLSDKFGRRPINLWGNLACLLLTYPIFAWITSSRSTTALIWGVVFLNCLQNFWTSSYYAGLSESLPPAIRSSGFGIAYSLALAAFGGTTQLVITWLIHWTGSAMAPAWYLIGASVAGQLALLMVGESAPVKRAALPSAAVALS
jgi:MFS transporter, MHS family, citrate/tricarballylate:H+ symporter